MGWTSSAALAVMSMAILWLASGLLSHRRLTRVLPTWPQLKAELAMPPVQRWSLRELWRAVVKALIMLWPLVVIEFSAVLLPAWIAAAVIVLLLAGTVAWHAAEDPSMRMLVLAPLVVVSEFWMIANTWWAQDLAGMVICTGLVLLVGRMFARRSVAFQFALSGVLVAYDIYAVFVTGSMQAGVHENLASARPIPSVFVIPDLFSPHRAQLLGFGDVYLPGVLVMTAAYLATHHGYARMLWAALAGYLVGQIVSSVVLIATLSAQPATLYLVPATALGMCVAARSHGLSWGEFLRFQPGRQLLGYTEGAWILAR